MHYLSRTVARNSAFGMVAQIIIKVLSFLFSVSIVRNLGVEAYGQYAGIIAFGMVFVFLADLGLSPYAVRQVARWRNDPDGITRANALYGNLLVLRGVLAVFTAAVIVAVAVLTGRPWVMIGGIALSTISLLFYAVQGSSAAILAGFERLDLSAGANVINQLVFVVMGAIVLWAGIGYYGLILASLLGVAAMALVFWRSVHSLGVRAGHIVVTNWLPLLQVSLPFSIIGLALGLSYKFDSFLLSIFRGDAETGYYNAAYNLVFSAVVVSNVVNTALYPSLSRYAVNTTEKLGATYERALRYLMALSLPIAVGISILADQIVPFLYKSNYAPAVPALRIVIWVVPLMYVSEFLGYVVLIADNEKHAARSVVVSTMLNVIFNSFFVPQFGFIAAAVMTVVTEIVLVGQYVWLLRTQLQQLNWGYMLRTGIAALLMGGVVFVFHDLPLVLNALLGAFVFMGLLIVFRVVGLEEWRFFTSLRQHAESPVVK
jgi:O-antigen/teichoic acid export membrane protein